jgi:hypothetical protein
MDYQSVNPFEGETLQAFDGVAEERLEQFIAAAAASPAYPMAD